MIKVTTPNHWLRRIRGIVKMLFAKEYILVTEGKYDLFCSKQMISDTVTVLYNLDDITEGEKAVAVTNELINT